MHPKRILLKLSGEMFKGEEAVLSPNFISELAAELLRIQKKIPEIVIVVGAGNIVRGAIAEELGASRVSGDYMGMLATVINGMALHDAITAKFGSSMLYSPFTLPQMTETYNPIHARRKLAEGNIVICAGGTGNPYFTTDTAAALRAVELECDLLIKGTKVDGVYDMDPTRHEDAIFYPSITFQEAMEKQLAIMDQTAFSLCRDHGMQVKIGSMDNPEAIIKLITDEHTGSLVHE